MPHHNLKYLWHEHMKNSKFSIYWQQGYNHSLVLSVTFQYYSTIDYLFWSSLLLLYEFLLSTIYMQTCWEFYNYMLVTIFEWQKRSAQQIIIFSMFIMVMTKTSFSNKMQRGVGAWPCGLFFVPINDDGRDIQCFKNGKNFQ